MRLLIWEKWVNPLTSFGSDDAISDNKEDPFEKYEDSYQNLERVRYFTGGIYDPKLGPCIMGPMGLIPITEHGDPSRVYDFWMLHTNFPIDTQVQEIGSRIPGIEGWDTFSPYRARVAFGKAFERSAVMRAMAAALQATPAKRDDDGKIVATVKPAEKKSVLVDAVELLKAKLTKTGKTWAIFRKENGQLHVVADEESKVREVAEKQKQELVTTSWG